MGNSHGYVESWIVYEEYTMCCRFLQKLYFLKACSYFAINNERNDNLKTDDTNSKGFKTRYLSDCGFFLGFPGGKNHFILLATLGDTSGRNDN